MVDKILYQIASAKKMFCECYFIEAIVHLSALMFTRFFLYFRFKKNHSFIRFAPGYKKYKLYLYWELQSFDLAYHKHTIRNFISGLR